MAETDSLPWYEFDMLLEGMDEEFSEDEEGEGSEAPESQDDDSWMQEAGIKVHELRPAS